MKTLQEHYNAIKTGQGNKAQFVKQARNLFPEYFNQYTNYDNAVSVLKSKQIISEAAGGVVAKGFDIYDWKKILAEETENLPKKGDKYENVEVKIDNEGTTAKKNVTIVSVYPKDKSVIVRTEDGGDAIVSFEDLTKSKTISESVKSVEKETTKQVLDAQAHSFNNKDMKNADNVNFNEIMKGFYCEMKDEKNKDKTGDELKAMVVKNLAKDPLYYTKSGEFGTKGVGYTTEAPGLGTPKEPKGKHKASGYGDLNTKTEKVKSNVQDSLGNSEAKTSNPKKVKEMPDKGVSGVEKKMKLQEGNLGHNEEWSLRPEGRFWILTYSTADGNKEKTFDSEDEAKKWIKQNLDEALYQGPSVKVDAGGSLGGKRFIPRFTALSRDAVDAINAKGAKRLNWGKPHIKIVKSGDGVKLLISKLLVDTIVGSERGRSKLSLAVSKMGTGITPEEMSEVTGEFKKLVKVLSANGKLSQNGDYFLLDVPTKYNEKYNQFEMPLPAEVAESEMTEGEQKLRSLIRNIINEELNK